MSKRVNGKKGNRVRKHQNGSLSHRTKVRGTPRYIPLLESVVEEHSKTGSI